MTEDTESVSRVASVSSGYPSSGSCICRRIICGAKLVCSVTDRQVAIDLHAADTSAKSILIGRRVAAGAPATVESASLLFAAAIKDQQTFERNHFK